MAAMAFMQKYLDMNIQRVPELAQPNLTRHYLLEQKCKD